MINIYFADYLITLSLEKQTGYDTYIPFEELEKLNLNDFFSSCSKGYYQKKINIRGKEPTELIGFFKKNMPHIVAGGGVVQKDTGEILFIFRNNRWDLPKGKPEAGEAIAETAKREVEEECGVSGLEIMRSLPATFHVYFSEELGFILKESIWFQMHCERTGPLVIQREEGITDARWFSLPVPESILEGAFPAIKDLVLWCSRSGYLDLRS